MSDNNNKPKINVPRFNLTWLYVIIALIFAFLYFSGDEGSATKEVNYTEFQEMVTKGYADKIVAYDNNTVEMYIKPDHIVDVFKKMPTKSEEALLSMYKLAPWKLWTSFWMSRRKKETLPALFNTKRKVTILA